MRRRVSSGGWGLGEGRGRRLGEPAESAAMEDDRLARRGLLRLPEFEDLTEHDHVVAAVENVRDPAVEPGHRLTEDRIAGVSRCVVEGFESVPAARGELAGQLRVLLRQDVDRERSGFGDHRPGRRSPGRSDGDQRRLERERHERLERHAVRPAVVDTGDDREAAGELADGLLERVVVERLGWHEPPLPEF